MLRTGGARVSYPRNYQPAFPGDGIRVEKAVQGGDKAKQRRLRGRLIQDGERSFHAYSADELIEIDSLAHHGRPGVPY